MAEEVKNKRVLQIGYGAFGEVHAEAWARAGLAAGCLLIADTDGRALARAQARFPGVHVTTDGEAAMGDVDCIDILTPTDSHYRLACAAIAVGRDVFIEKPMTVHAWEALDLARRAREARIVLQGGLYYRQHPKALALKAAIAAGRFGALRLLTGRFAGIKRARNDSGALHNDAVHFIDLFNWLTGERPRLVFALTRDHFGRGHDDLAILQLVYPRGTIASIETGYIQPGRWPDAVVPGAVTMKEIAVSGELAIAEIDFAAEVSSLRRGGHRQQDGSWRPAYGEPEPIAAPSASAPEVLAGHFRTFLDHVASREEPECSIIDCGYVPARIIEAAIQSARTGQAIGLDWS
ncbi:MAG: Gfo/Idh/MocA family oxidoreductase [Alphaproteobacteria bacterium]|nr:Gfo/Idh/MocA family oxidoreductase [Alphaproteobacteria bacterium]